MNDAPGPKVLTGSFARAPWPLVVIAALVALAGVTMTVVGAGQTGLSADEMAHVKRLEAFYHDGLYVRDDERKRAVPGEMPDNAYVYSPATTRIMHVANVIAGHEGRGELSWEADAFIMRHYVVAAMSLLGLLATVGLAWLMLGSWRWGVVAAGALSAIPMWTGHAMFNPKDTPVAVGNTVMTVAIAALVVAAGRSGRFRRWSVVVTTLALIFGIVLMVGTRPGMWPAVFGAVVATVVILAVGRSLDRWVLLSLAVSLAGSYGLLWKLYPKVFIHPITMLKISVGQSASFPHGVSRGRSYVLERTAIEWPILLLIFLLVGTVIAAVASIRLMRSAPRRSAVFALVGVQAYALSAAAVITNANIYDGLRQLLFAVPGQALLATVGIAGAVTVARGRLLRGTVVSLAVAGLVLPTVVQARMFPYQYAYGNVVAEALGAEILNDNWKVSFREYVEEVPPTVKAICPNMPAAHEPVNPDESSDCRGTWGALKPHWLAYWYHPRLDPDSPEFYMVLRSQREVPPNCDVVDEVTRYRNFKRAVMSKLLHCSYDAKTMSAPGVTAS